MNKTAENNNIEAVRAAVIRNISTANPQKTAEIPEIMGITALYSRLSNDDGYDSQSISISNQKTMLERYCQEKNYGKIKHYEDDGYTGTNFNRPGFQQMIEDVKSGKIIRVIVKDLSRFGRNYLEVGMYTDIVFAQYSVHFIAVHDAVDSLKGENEFAAIKNIFNEMHARDTSRKINAVNQSKAKNSEKIGTIPPYGYMKDPNNRKKWIVDPEAAEVVRKIFSLCIDGLGLTKICNKLAESKIMKPSCYAESKGWKYFTKTKYPERPYIWNPKTLRHILKNMEYLGHTVNFSTKTIPFKSITKENDPTEWQIVENTHEAIIDEHSFIIVQGLRENRRRITKLGEADMLSGMLYCMDCNAVMHHHRAATMNQSQTNFVCSTYSKTRIYAMNQCTPHTIRKIVAEEAILQDLRRITAYIAQYEAEFIRVATESSENEREKDLARKQAELEKITRRISELDILFKKLYEDNTLGRINDERYEKLTAGYEEEQKTLTEEANTLRKKVTAHAKKKTDVSTFVRTAKKYTDIQTLDATLLREFIHRIYIGKTVRKGEVRDIKIVYNFIGEFDFDVQNDRFK